MHTTLGEMRLTLRRRLYWSRLKVANCQRRSSRVCYRWYGRNPVRHPRVSVR